MKRSAFLGGALASALPRGARASDLRAQIAEAEAHSSGIVGAVAHRLGGTIALAYNADEQFPSASVIKVLILVCLVQAAERDRTLMGQTVRLRAADMVGGSEFLQYAGPGDAYTVASLARAMIVQSDNAASNTLITLLGFDRINATAQAAGLHRTQLKRHFLDYTAIVKHSENLTTPRDMARLLYAIERGAHEAIRTVASPMSCRHMIDILLHQEDRDKIVRALPRGTPVANKTGEIDGVRNDVAIVDPYGDAPYVLTVLTKDLADFSEGNLAIRRIAKAVNTAFSS